MPFAGPVCRTIRGLLIVGAIIACGAPAQAETLRVGKSTLTSFTYTLLEVGMQSGIFEKHGLTIESSAFGGGPRLIQGMTAGAIDIGLDGGTDMAMIVKGAPMKGIAPLSGAPVEMVISREGRRPDQDRRRPQGQEDRHHRRRHLDRLDHPRAGPEPGLGRERRQLCHELQHRGVAGAAEGRRDRRGHHRHVDDPGERAARRGAAVVHLRRSGQGLPHADHLRHRQGHGGKAASGARLHGGMARDHRLCQGEQGQDRLDHPAGARTSIPTC